MEPDEKRFKQATSEEILQELEMRDEQNQIEEIKAEQERLLAERLQANEIRMQQAPPALPLEIIDPELPEKIKIIQAHFGNIVPAGSLNPEELFIVCVWIGNLELTKSLIWHGLTGNEQKIPHIKENGLKACSTAPKITKEHLDIVEFLIEIGADVNHTNPAGNSALILAAQHGHDEICELLLKNGATVNHANAQGDSALMRAAQQDHYKICELLLMNGANVNHANANGETAFMCAAYEEHDKICELLLKNGADIEAQNNEGNTALAEAFIYEHWKTAQVLIKHGANPNRHNSRGQSIIERWIDADFSVVDYYDFSEELPFSTFVMLLEHGADPNIRNRVNGQTPLHACARNAVRCKQIIELLLQYNADHTLVDNNNKTAFDLIDINPDEATDLELDENRYMEHIGNILSDASTINAIKNRRVNNPRIEIPLLTKIKNRYSVSNAFTALFNREIGSHGKQLVIKRVQPQKNTNYE